MSLTTVKQINMVYNKSFNSTEFLKTFQFNFTLKTCAFSRNNFKNLMILLSYHLTCKGKTMGQF